MDIIKTAIAAPLYILLIGSSNIAWAVVKTEPSNGASYLFIVVAVLGGIITFLGIILTFRGVTSPAEVSVKIPSIVAFKFNKVGQGVVLAIIGSIVLVSALYMYPSTTTKTITETTITEGDNGVSTRHMEMAR